MRRIADCFHRDEYSCPSCHKKGTTHELCQYSLHQINGLPHELLHVESKGKSSALPSVSKLLCHVEEQIHLQGRVGYEGQLPCYVQRWPGRGRPRGVRERHP